MEITTNIMGILSIITAGMRQIGIMVMVYILKMIPGGNTYENNVIVNSFDNDIQMYGSSASNLNNFTFEGNVWMNHLALFGGNSPINNLMLDKNYFYLSPFTIGYSSSYNSGIAVINNLCC